MKTSVVTSRSRLSQPGRKSLQALVVLAAMQAATVAQAAIITVTSSIAVPNNIEGVFINLVTGTTDFVESTATPGWDFNPYGSSGNLNFYWTSAGGSSTGGVASTTNGPYHDLAVGSVVSSASTLTKVVAGTTGTPFRLSGSHILGLAFLNESTGIVNYGYLTMTNTGATGFPATVTGWSYDNTGAAITVGSGEVPLPATLGLLSMGALLAGVGSLRKRWTGQATALS